MSAPPAAIWEYYAGSAWREFTTFVDAQDAGHDDSPDGTNVSILGAMVRINS